MATAKKAAAAKTVAAPAAAPEAAVPAKKTTKKAAAVEATPAKPTPAFMKPLTPSAELAAIVGKKALPRTEVTKKVWEYIKKHKLQDEADRRRINADAKLKAVLKQDQVSMFEMTKLLSAHLS